MKCLSHDGKEQTLPLIGLQIASDDWLIMHNMILTVSIKLYASLMESVLT